MNRMALRFLTLTSLLVGIGQAKADLVYTLNDTTNGVSATADFAITSNGFVITITNTESNTADAGHAISQFSFAINSASLGTVTSFSELAGVETAFTGSTTPVDNTSAGSLKLHWQFSGSGPFLLDALSGAQPNHLIVAAGSTPNSSLTNNHTPSFIGATQFFFTTSTAPTSLSRDDITGFQFAFGTMAEVPLESASGSGTSHQGIVTPEPSTIALALSGLAATGFVGIRRHRRDSRASA